MALRVRRIPRQPVPAAHLTAAPPPAAMEPSPGSAAPAPTARRKALALLCAVMVVLLLGGLMRIVKIPAVLAMTVVVFLPLANWVIHFEAARVHDRESSATQVALVVLLQVPAIFSLLIGSENTLTLFGNATQLALVSTALLLGTTGFGWLAAARSNGGVSAPPRSLLPSRVLSAPAGASRTTPSRTGIVLSTPARPRVCGICMGELRTGERSRTCARCAAPGARRQTQVHDECARGRKCPTCRMEFN